MRFLINVFIVTHLWLIAAWLFPFMPSLPAINSFFSRYIIFLGLDQNYSMFAPTVRRTNRHLIALLTFQNLSTVIWSYPRVERMGFMEAMQKERYRKFANDNVVEPRFRMFLPDFARYIARTYGCPASSPRRISIFLSETNIPEPGGQLNKAPASNVALPERCRLTNIFTYEVQTEDLIGKSHEN